LTCSGRVTAKSGDTVELALSETNQRGETCAQGSATVRLPSRGDRS